MLSAKSAIVASDAKLAKRVASELLSYGLVVQTPKSTRDLGVMFTAGCFRDVSKLKTIRNKKDLESHSRVTRMSWDIRKPSESR